jgi:hypothetical protein
MGQKNPIDEHVDPQTERAFLASISRAEEPAALFYELEPRVELFAACPQAFEDLSGAIEAGEEVPTVPDDWATAGDPEEALSALKTLWERREGVEAMEALRGGVYGDRPIGDAYETAVDRLESARGALRSDDAGTLMYPGDLVPDVLKEAKEARENVQAGGDGIMGVRSGIDRLDEILGGFQPGLTILSGGPGTGKTTFALQVALSVADTEAPALYLTFENTPEQLTRRGIAAVGGMDSKDVRRGRVPMKDVQAAAERWNERARRLAIVDGHGKLTRPQIRAKAQRHMNRFGAERCLVVVDYLQFYAKIADDLGGMETRAKVEVMGDELRNEVGKRLRSPVLAISSQSRRGYNGDGEAKVRLDTLKESGDLEYTADAVAFLTPPLKDETRQATGKAKALDLTVAKNRHGEKGAVELIFRPDHGTFRPESERTAPSGDGVPRADSAVF